MKKLTTLIAILLCAATLFAQSPEKFTYQAVVRNASNSLVANAQVGVRVNILQGSASGNAVYSESHVATTNANGLVTVNIGGGNVQQGTFANIDWANGPFFLKTETDPNGGTNYSITSVQQLLSVPYALYAKDAGNGFSGDYNDLTNTPVIPTVPTNVSAFNNDAGYISGYTETDPQYNAWDKDYNDLINRPVIPTVPTNVSAFNNDAGYITMDSVPTIPTNVSAFTNDAGYLTSFTEADPQFNAWDKDYNDLINTPIIPTVPTNVSAFENDAYYITEGELQQTVNVIDNTFDSVGNVMTDMNNTMNDMDNTIDSLRTRIDELEGHNTPPTVMTTGVSDVVYHSATVNGSVVYIGGAPVAAKGFCYDTLMHPTVESATVSCGSGSGSFSANLLNLTSSTTYYVRAYATNMWGTNYGEEKVFTTLTEYSPSVEIVLATEISYTSFFCGGDVTDSGTYAVTARGLCWSTAPDPVMTSDHLHLGNGTGTFSATLTNMQPETTYYLRAYAVNSVGVSYSNAITVTTLTPTLPTVTTDSISDYNECMATVVSDGGAPVTQRGFCYDTLPNPTLENNVVYVDGGEGEFSATLTGLPIGKLYFVRAFATNAKGTTYGNQFDFYGGCDSKTITDYDGNVYNTVLIGNQCWMKENLRTTHYSDGWPIEQSRAKSTTTPYYCYPNNSPDNSETYGLLYNWKATMRDAESTDSIPSGVQGICPEGWHVPSPAEWNILINFAKRPEFDCNAAVVLADSILWETSNNGACCVGYNSSKNNASGFSARPAGTTYDQGASTSYLVFTGFGYETSFWSTWITLNSWPVYVRTISNNSTSTNINNGSHFISYSFASVRCLRDY